MCFLIPATHVIVKLGEEGHLKRRGANNENRMYTPTHTHTHTHTHTNAFACNYISVSQVYFSAGIPKIILLYLEEILTTKTITDQKKKEAVGSTRKLFQNSQLLNKNSRGISEVIQNFSRQFRLLVCLVYDFWRDPG